MTIDNKILQLNDRAAVFIPKIKNIGENQLSFIGVQTGDVLDEKDVIRYDDIYGLVEL